MHGGSGIRSTSAIQRAIRPGRRGRPARPIPPRRNSIERIPHLTFQYFPILGGGREGRGQPTTTVHDPSVAADWETQTRRGRNVERRVGSGFRPPTEHGEADRKTTRKERKERERNVDPCATNQRYPSHTRGKERNKPHDQVVQRIQPTRVQKQENGGNRRSKGKGRNPRDEQNTHPNQSAKDAFRRLEAWSRVGHRCSTQSNPSRSGERSWRRKELQSRGSVGNRILDSSDGNQSTARGRTSKHTSWKRTRWRGSWGNHRPCLGAGREWEVQHASDQWIGRHAGGLESSTEKNSWNSGSRRWSDLGHDVSPCTQKEQHRRRSCIHGAGRPTVPDCLRVRRRKGSGVCLHSPRTGVSKGHRTGRREGPQRRVAGGPLCPCCGDFGRLHTGVQYTTAVRKRSCLYFVGRLLRVVPSSPGRWYDCER
mmetsp:Transcript_10506/g.64342  ORF Transcript_10506/g.64342 Transcript_10506/m.64342 type:complete len:425 (-) Transcript_10506:3609-4883(-)